MEVLQFPLIIFLLLTTSINCENFITYEPPSSCLITANETFSGSKLSCTKCQWASLNGSRSNTDPPCPPCPSGYWLTGSGCKKCHKGTLSQDQMSCLRCTDDYPFNVTSGQCSTCPEGHIHAVRNDDGSPNGVFECTQCADGMTSSRSSERCVPCHRSFSLRNSTGGVCNCSHTNKNGVCVESVPELQFDDTNLYRIHYDGGDTKSLESSFLKDHLVSAFYLCLSFKNESACQLVANACTMQLHYSEDNACKLYESVKKKHGVDSGTVPKLIYDDHLVLLQRRDFISQEFTSDFQDQSSDFNVTVARYSVTGHFLGIALLTDLVPCQGQLTSKQIKQKFGVTSRSECQIRLSDFLIAAPQEMELWDTYIAVGSEQKPSLYPIPIKIMNIQTDGIRVNEAKDNYQWKMVRRFFLLDNVGGIESTTANSNQEKANKTPKVFRYVEKISIGIQLQQQENAGRVFVPVLTVHYNQFRVEDLQNEVTFTYEIEYFMDMSRAIEDIKISVGVISALAVLLAAIQTWTWNRRNGRAEIDLETILTLVLTSSGNIADAFVLVCFGTGVYWWIFFKKQVAVHVFLPHATQERLIRDLLISAFALKAVDLLKLIWRQVSVDVFFVDWEKPKAGSVIQRPSDDKAPQNGAGEDKQSVSIWRSYFVANEWNEIQSSRKINLALQIVLTLLFLEVFGFKYWGLHWPSATLNPGEEAADIPYSTVARFTTSCLIFTFLGLAQWAWNVGIYERFVSNKIQDFVDICTLANVSVFILSAKQYGFYIHGRSVHGFADTDMRTMVEQLNREEEDLCGRRGLVATHDQQTFIISIPRSLRTVYDQVLQPLYAQSSKLVAHAQSSVTGSSKGSAAAGTTKASMSQLNLSAHAYHSMNRFLTSFLEHALSDIDYEVTDKSFIETSLDMEFRETGERAVFYNDEGHSFDSVLFYGNERTIFLFDLYVFNFIDILCHNYVLAGIVTFLVDLVLKSFRKSLGKRNLARKTLIDRRFLI